MEANHHESRVGYWFLVVLGVLLTPLVLFMAAWLILVGPYVWVEWKLQKPKVYEPLARRLALYCQSDQSLFPEYFSSAWLPEELAKVCEGRGSVNSNSAHVEFGGGFYHYGYIVERDNAASSSVTNIWQVSLYREGKPEKKLMTLAVAATEHIKAEEILQLASKSFDDLIRNGQYEAYESKVLLKLRFGKTNEAADVCKAWVQHVPNSWLARFTYAHLRCRLGETEPASAEFTQWVQSHKNFAHCIYLALFELREGRTNQAASAVRLAVNQPFVEPANTDGNKFYLGQNGALIAFLNGDYDLTLAMCEKMLASPDQELWWKRKVMRLKAAAMLMKGNEPAAIEKMKQSEASRDNGATFSLDGMVKSDNQLRTAIEKNDLAYVKNPANWSDEMDKWFTPFETDETGIHGAKVPTPYPDSWKSDIMHPAEESR